MNYASCFFLPVFLFCFRIFSRPTLYLVPKSPWSPPTWDCSSVFPYHSWPWWYGCLLASYFLGCHSTWVFLMFLMIILKLYKHLAKIPWKYHCVPLSSLSQEIPGISLSHYSWCYAWSVSYCDVYQIAPVKSDYFCFCF